MTRRRKLLEAAFRWMGIIAAFALAVAVWAGQPIRFNHQKHISAVGLGCSDCHIYAASQPFAGLPGLEICMNCHEEPQTKNAEEQKLRTLQEQGGSLHWNTIYKVPDHVYFSHQRHVTGGEIDCSVCHGRMAEFKTPPSRQEVPISMDRCMKCHQQSNVNNDCLTCHK